MLISEDVLPRPHEAVREASWQLEIGALPFRLVDFDPACRAWS